MLVIHDTTGTYNSEWIIYDNLRSGLIAVLHDIDCSDNKRKLYLTMHGRKYPLDIRDLCSFGGSIKYDELKNIYVAGATEGDMHFFHSIDEANNYISEIEDEIGAGYADEVQMDLNETLQMRLNAAVASYNRLKKHLAAYKKKQKG